MSSSAIVNYSSNSTLLNAKQNISAYMQDLNVISSDALIKARAMKCLTLRVVMSDTPRFLRLHLFEDSPSDVGSVYAKESNWPFSRFPNGLTTVLFRWSWKSFWTYRASSRWTMSSFTRSSPLLFSRRPNFINRIWFSSIGGNSLRRNETLPSGAGVCPLPIDLFLLVRMDVRQFWSSWLRSCSRPRTCSFVFRHMLLFVTDQEVGFHRNILSKRIQEQNQLVNLYVNAILVWLSHNKSMHNNLIRVIFTKW